MSSNSPGNKIREKEVEMKTKDVIALWILVFFVLVPAGKFVYGVTDAFRLHLPAKAVLWAIAQALLVGSCGLFLISHFVGLNQRLEYYEAQEKKRENDR